MSEQPKDPRTAEFFARKAAARQGGERRQQAGQSRVQPDAADDGEAQPQPAATAMSRQPVARDIFAPLAVAAAGGDPGERTAVQLRLTSVIRGDGESLAVIGGNVSVPVAVLTGLVR